MNWLMYLRMCVPRMSCTFLVVGNADSVVSWFESVLLCDIRSLSFLLGCKVNARVDA
jgi:hypothetical protein